MKLDILKLAAAAAFLAAPALAQDQVSAPAPDAAAATTDAAADASANKLICRKSTDTGTRLKARRVCYTREQWTQVNRQARESLKHSRTAGGN